MYFVYIYFFTTGQSPSYLLATGHSPSYLVPTSHSPSYLLPTSQSPSYLFALSYYDQLTWGAIRLRSLQCWAKHSNGSMISARIVAPFVTNSHFRIPTVVSGESLNDTLSFGNLFNLDVWNELGGEFGFPPVVNWSHFLQHAPRNVILVQIVYSPNQLCPEVAFTDKACNPERLRTFWSKALEPHSFTIQREVCINFRQQKGYITVEKFNKLIFGTLPSYAPFTMIFDEWRGNSFKLRQCFIALHDMAHCSPTDQKLMNMTKQSLSLAPEIVNVAKKYMERYLSGTGSYTAIVIRWEKILLYHFYFKKSSRFFGSKCVGMIESFLEKTYHEKHLDMAFLATDIGKYGSSTFNLYDSTREGLQNVARYTDELLRHMYGKAMTWDDYETTFEVISGTTDPAFISLLQKAVAARAECLLMIGWGTFHEHTLKLYQELHEGNACYKVIETC